MRKRIQLFGFFRVYQPKTWSDYMNCYSVFREIDTFSRDYDLAFKWKHEARLALINVSLFHSSLHRHNSLTNGTTIRVEWGFVVCIYIIPDVLHITAGRVLYCLCPTSEVSGEWEFCGETGDAYVEFGTQKKTFGFEGRSVSPRNRPNSQIP